MNLLLKLMDQKKHPIVILENDAFKLFLDGNFIASEKKYKELLALNYPENIGTSDILLNFSLVVSKLNKEKEAENILEKALKSALKYNTNESIAITQIRFSLAECRMHLKEYDKALEPIQPSINIKSEHKWLLYLIASKIHYKSGNTEKYKECVSRVMSLAPEGKYPSLNELEKIVTQ